MKISKIFQLKIDIFTAVKNHCILQRHVFVMFILQMLIRCVIRSSLCLRLNSSVDWNTLYDFHITSEITFKWRHDKPCIRGFRPGPIHTGCTTTEDGYRLEIFEVGSRGVVIYVAKTKTLICAFVFAYEKHRCSLDAAQFWIAISVTSQMLPNGPHFSKNLLNKMQKLQKWPIILFRTVVKSKSSEWEIFTDFQKCLTEMEILD